MLSVFFRIVLPVATQDVLLRLLGCGSKRRMEHQYIADNITVIRERISRAARRANRDEATVTLIAVTKTHPIELIEAALAHGINDCGENRVGEAEEKKARLSGDTPRWHLIGHLQRNKARRAVSIFDMIHSLDSLRLAQALDRHVVEEGRLERLPVLLQVNVSGEESKEGFAVHSGIENRHAMPAFLTAVEQIVALPHLHVQGLMTVAPYDLDPEAARPTFRALHQLRDELARRFPAAGWQHLSMGMTGDFEVAIEEGATLVRVGRAIFGERG
jgi:pyridoxal phosphate enzyme (YggS family)